MLLGASLVLLARVVLITAYQYLGDRQAGIDGTLGLRLLEEVTGAVTALPLLAVVAGGAARWPIVDPRWRRNLAPLVLLLVAFSVTHTLLMEWARGATFPLIGETRDVSVAALRAAGAHEFPNDLFNLALVVASVEVWRFAWRTGERQRHDAQLRASLVEAQLTSLHHANQMKWIAPLLAYLAVGFGILHFHNAWGALLGFHTAIIISLLIAKPNIPVSILLKSRNINWIFLNILLCGSSGLAVCISFGIPLDLQMPGLRRLRYPPRRYFARLSPAAAPCR